MNNKRKEPQAANPRVSRPLMLRRSISISSVMTHQSTALASNLNTKLVSLPIQSHSVLDKAFRLGMLEEKDGMRPQMDADQRGC